MPTLDLTPQMAYELLELADRADDLTMLDLQERRRLHNLGGLLRGALLGVPR